MNVITTDDVTIGVFDVPPIRLKTRHNLVVRLEPDEVVALIAGLAENARDHGVTYLALEVPQDSRWLRLAELTEEGESR